MTEHEKLTMALVSESARSRTSPCGDSESSDLNGGNDGSETVIGLLKHSNSALIPSTVHPLLPTFLNFFLLLFKWVLMIAESYMSLRK